MTELVKRIPSVSEILNDSRIKDLPVDVGTDFITEIVRFKLEELRMSILSGSLSFDKEKLVIDIANLIMKSTQSKVKSVINATGIVLHTNLGRAPLGKYLHEKLEKLFRGYTNLEIDLQSGNRGKRDDLTKDLLRLLTNAESSTIVNNNAAAVYLVLNTLSNDSEVIVSRGELIEIGGSFRIPDIIRQSGAKLVEVGTTNKTRLSDYENAVNDKTRVIMKAHRSNFYIGGFTEEVQLSELADLAKSHKIITFYDLGSGLLKKPSTLRGLKEPDVTYAVKSGVDIISFSADKLFGGPQAGIIIGKQHLINSLIKSPLMRVLRVDKITISLIESILIQYLNEEQLAKNVKIFEILSQTDKVLESKARKLHKSLKKLNIDSVIVRHNAHCGGGTLPDLTIDSYAIKLSIPNDKNGTTAHKIYKSLLSLENPVLGVLQSGELLFDIYTVDITDAEYISKSISKIYHKNLK